LANKTAVLYQRVKINNKWTFKKAPGSRLRRLEEGSYYVSWYNGTNKQLEPIGPEPSVAVTALRKEVASESHSSISQSFW
jgi:dolichyl-phosphate-mannose--protein O-mannosyl transferase